MAGWTVSRFSDAPTRAVAWFEHAEDARAWASQYSDAWVQQVSASPHEAEQERDRMRAELESIEADATRMSAILGEIAYAAKGKSK